MRILDENTVTAALDYAGAIEALRTALTSDFDPADDATRLSAPLSRGEFLFMPAEIGAYAAVKVLTVTPDNPAAGHPRIQGSCLLLDSRTHRTLAILDGPAITNLRTPAVSLAGVSDALTARFPDGVRMTVFGAGVQGLLHVHAARAVVPVKEATVVVRSAGRGADFLRGLADLGIPGTEVVGTDDSGADSADLTAALAASDLVVTATSAAEPLFDDAAIRDDAVVIAMGSHSPEARELPAALLGRSTVIVESRHTALDECGDVVLAIADGALTIEDTVTFKEVVTSGGAVLAGDRPVVFKTSGMSWEDLVVSTAVYEKAS